MTRATLIGTVLTLAMVLGTGTDSLAQNVRVSEIPLHGEHRGLWSAPLDDRPGEDLLLCTWSREHGRELSVHLQDDDGRFGSYPEQRIPVKSDIVAFAVADVRDEPGSELLFFTRSSCFSYSTRKQGYAGNVQRLFTWNLLCDVPSGDRLLFVDGALSRRDFLVPGRDGFGIFSRGPEGYRLSQEIPVSTAPRARGGPRGGFQVRMSLSNLGLRHARFVHLPDDPPADGEDLLSTSRWIHGATLADVDGDGQSDVVHVADPDELAVVRPGQNTLLSPLPAADELRLLDLDGDGAADLLGLSQPKPGTYRLTFYKSTAGRFDSEPDGVLKFSGYRLLVDATDLDGDGKPELVVTSYDIPQKVALGEATIERRLFIHAPDDERIFSRRPAFSDTRSYSASNIEGVNRPRVGPAIGGRGQDLFSLEDDGTLSARHIGDDLQLAPKPHWSRRFDQRIWEFRVETLNDDGKPDLLVRHPRSIRTVVSRP